MHKKGWEMIEIIKKLAESYGVFDSAFVEALVYALEDVLSLNDFNTLKERLREEIKNGADEKDS